MLNTIMYNGQYLQSGSPHTFTVDTPLVFQWLPRKYGYLIPEKYLERLSEWAKRESTRVVKLVINGSGFTPMQRKELENKISSREFNPNKNIELIDFNELDLGEYEFSFHLQKLWQFEKSKCPLYKVSQYFRDLYSIPEDERLSFCVEIDSMRIFMLLVLKSPMIYFDFDILPKENKKIGEIHARQGFLLAENNGTGHSYSGMISIENAIIAVSDAGRIKIKEIYNEVKRRFEEYYPMLISAPSYVYTITDAIICYSLSNEYLLDKKSVIEEIFGFKTNGGEVDIQYDNSWKKEKNELYTKKEIARIDSDTRVATDMKGLITEPIYNGEHMYRGVKVVT